MLWGALNNSSTAMMAFSTDMGSISQNIANVNTTGYKRTETMFKTMMSEGHASPNSYVSGLNVFGVQAVQRNHIQAQGIIQPSSTWSDMAINGHGFFMVAPPATGTTGVPTSVDLQDSNAVYYTRDGSWRRTYGPDTDPNLARNYFVTGGGNYLMGWMADDTGAISKSATLEPVYTLGPRPIPNNGTAAVDQSSTLTPATVQMPGRATTNVSVVANLPSKAPMTPNIFAGTKTVTDPNTGASQNVTMTWQRDTVDPTLWTVTPSVDPAAGTVTSSPITVKMDGWGVITQPNSGADAIDISWTSGATTTNTNLMGPATNINSATIVDPLGSPQQVDLTWTQISGNVYEVVPALNNASVGVLDDTPVRVVLDASGNIMSPSGGIQSLGLTWDAGTYGAGIDDTIKLNLNGAAPVVAVDAPKAYPQKISATIYDDQYVAHTVTMGFEHTGNNSWMLYFDGGPGVDPTTLPAPMQVAFNSDGSLDTTPMNPDGTVDTTFTANPLIASFDWTVGVGDPPVQTASSATFTLDLQKLSQYDSSSVYIGDINTDGYGQGTLISTAFTETGELQGYFTNGRSRTLFKVPVANFIAEDALDPISGNLFRRTAEAGDVVVSAIEDAPGEARFATSSLEGSTTEIEDEFTRMIMTQKAYSTNAQVFKTADEMMQGARDLKR